MTNVNAKATVLFLAYNQECYVAEALTSILAQDVWPLEVVVAEDASTDDTYAVIERTLAGYAGPHQVMLQRHARNVGRATLGIEHIALLMQRPTCEHIILAHGDDVAEPHRVRRMLELFAATGADVVSSNSIDIDAQGRPGKLRVPTGDSRHLSAQELVASLERPQETIGAALAWRRVVYDAFPWLDAGRASQGHDTVVPFRGALLGGLYYCAEPLLRYRRHAGNGQWRLASQADASCQEEGWMSRRICAAVTMLNDLKHLERTTDAVDDNLQRLRAMLETQLLTRLTQWMAARGELWRNGWRPHWIPQDEFEQRNRQQHAQASAARRRR